MKNKELFYKTVDILVKAYQNDTLIHTNCTACAIGNLICHYNNYTIDKEGQVFYKPDGTFIPAEWYDPFFDKIYETSLETVVGLSQLESTGYSIEESLLIERAFELTEKGIRACDDKDGYLGLMAVVDTLMHIHEATTEEATAAKELFVKA